MAVTSFGCGPINIKTISSSMGIALELPGDISPSHVFDRGCFLAFSHVSRTKRLTG
jgi:hypothetical protein